MDVEGLTWGDLEECFGTAVLERGKKYFEEGAVEELYQMTENELIAKVRGSEVYITVVHVDEDGIDSECSCPYGDNCKHSVAALLEYASALKKGIDVAVIDEGKLERWLSVLEDETSLMSEVFSFSQNKPYTGTELRSLLGEFNEGRVAFNADGSGGSFPIS